MQLVFARESSRDRICVVLSPDRVRASRLSMRLPDSQIVLGIALISAVAASVSDVEPTGTALWDNVLAAAAGAVVCIAAAKSPRWPLIVMGMTAAAASFLTPWAIAGWVSLVLAIGTSLLDRRSRALGSLSAAFALQALLRLPQFGFFGLQSVVAAAAITPVLFLGYLSGSREARRWTRWSLITGTLVVSVIVVLGSLSLLNARTDVNEGVAAARRSLDAAKAGDAARVVEELERSELKFGAANTAVSGAFARLFRLIPVAAQNQRSIEVAISQGSIISGDAAVAFRDADIRSLRFDAGSLDLQAMSAMAPQLRSTTNSLVTASNAISDASSPWLLPVVSNRVADLLNEVEELRPTIELGANAAEIVPEMLGALQPTSYFVMFGTPAESRELGGFLGSWALLSFDNGTLTLGESGRINELTALAMASSLDEQTVSAWYLEMARPTRFPQNLTSSPDMQQVASIAQQVLAGVSPEPIDGFIYVDGHALTDLLEISGPVSIPSREEALTSQNGFQFFFEEQYRVTGGEERTELFDALAGVAAGVVTGIKGQTLVGPEELGRVMGPAARGGHLQVVTFDEQANDFLRSVKLLRGFGRAETQDFVGLVQTNGLSNKIDLYLHRELDYRVTVEEDGKVDATAAVTLRSDIPSDAPPRTLGSGGTAGINKVLLSLYSPLTLDGATINGIPADARIASEFGMGRYLVEVDVLPNGEAILVEYLLSGSLLTDVPYSLEVWHQPLVNDDDVAISAVGPDFEISWDGKLVENLIVSADPGEAS